MQGINKNAENYKQCKNKMQKNAETRQMQKNAEE